MTAVEIDDLHFRYPAQAEWLLSGVNLRVEAGEVVLLVGPSGAGKSTLARCVNGLIPHALPGEIEGTVSVCGNDTTETSLSELTTDVGLVFQNPDTQFVTSTVADEVAFGPENIQVPRDEIERRIEDALGRVGLDGYERRRIEPLSGGEKQRLAIACQLAMKPDVMVFDEPTASLDPAGRTGVFETIRSIVDSDERAALLIEHRCDDILDLVDRVVVLEPNGRTTFDGPPRAVFSEHTEYLRSIGVRVPEITRFTDEIRSESHWPQSGRLPVTVDTAVETLRDVDPPRVRSPVRRSSTEESLDGGSDRTTPPALAIRDLHATYDEGSSSPVLTGVDLTVPPGTILAVVGPNGAGKSTLAKHCVDVCTPPPDTVYLDGEDVTTLSSAQLYDQIGYVFQNPERQFVADSVRAELRHELDRPTEDPTTTDTRVDRALDRFGLSHRADANPFTLSHGEKRRLSVATMLVGGRETVVLDEPTTGQDGDSARTLLETISDLRDTGRTIVWLTHDMELVAKYADCVAVLVDGSIRFKGRPPDLFADDDLLEAAGLTRPPVARLARALRDADAGWATVVDWARRGGWKRRERGVTLGHDTVSDTP